MRFLAILTLVMVTAGLVSSQQRQTALTEESLKTDLQANTCENDRRLEFAKKLFASKGAAESDIKLEKFENAENLTVTKKGRTEEIVVVGAHYDKADDGCGAIDNWTGVVILANLFAALKEMQTQKTYVFVAFGKEEKGLVGSAAMAKAIPKERRPFYCAMVNFDSFGLAYPQVLSNTSSGKMTKFAKELASGEDALQ